MDHHDKGHDHNAGDRRDVADEIEVELVIERRVNSVRRGREKERITVWSRTDDRLGGDIAVCSGPVLDDEWLAEPLREPWTKAGSSLARCPLYLR
jgi:hypothetical protein